MIPTLLMQLADGTLDTRTRDGIVSAAGVGALRFRDGGALVEEAGANYIRDPLGYNVSTSNGWATSSSGGATPWEVAQDTSVRRDGVPSVRLSYSPEFRLIASIRTNQSFTEGQAAVWSGALRSNRPGAPYELQFRSRDLAVSLVTEVVTPAVDAWTPFEILAESLPEGVGELQPYIYTPNSQNGQPGDEVWIAQPQVEDGTYATTPIPEFEADGTTLKPGYAWTGTAHASHSTRAETSILAPCELPGWVAVRYSEDFGQTWDTAILDGTGTVGDYGQVSHDGDNLVLASDRATIYGQVMAGNGTLTPEQQATLIDADGDWMWDMFVPRFGGIHVSVPIEPIAVAVSVPVDVTGG